MSFSYQDDPPEGGVPPFDPESPDGGTGMAGFLADLDALSRLANAKMPFGKYAGRYLVDLPETYVLWFKGQGYPAGALGDQLRAIEEIKVNGLEFLLRPLIGR